MAEVKSQPVLMQRTILSAAQIQNLHSISQNLTPKPPPRKLIDIISCTGKYNFGTTNFTNSDLYIYSLGISNVPNNWQFIMKNFFDQSFSLYKKGLPNFVGNPIPNESTILAGRILCATKFDSAIGDGTAEITVYYRLIDEVQL